MQLEVTTTVNPMLSPPGAYLFQAHLRIGLIETGDLFDLEKTMVSVLHKELEYKGGKAQVQEGYRSCSRGSE